MTDLTTTKEAPEEQEPLRLGVIGAGWFASRRHLPDIQKNPQATLSALCRRDPEARATLVEHFKLPPGSAFADWRQMLDQVALDAVLIATPHALHYEQAKEALERGLHVLLEKPMTLHGAEARELVALAKARGLKLAVALNPPHWAHCHQLRRALKNEAMGTLESAAMYWTGAANYLFGRSPRPADLPGVVPPTDYRADPELNGGGYFIDGGPHLVSELLWVTGLRVRQVTCLMDTLPVDMRAVLSLRMENGAIASITSIGDSQYPNRRVRNVFGATGGVATVIGFDFETNINIQGQEHRKFREADLPPVASPIANFVDAIQGRSALYSPGEHGAHVVEVVEAAYQSAGAGQTISLD